MKLYGEYNKVIKKIGKIEKAYFTTFNMDIAFVEKLQELSLTEQEYYDLESRKSEAQNYLDRIPGIQSHIAAFNFQGLEEAVAKKMTSYIENTPVVVAKEAISVKFVGQSI